MKNFQYLTLYTEKEYGTKKKELSEAGNEKEDY